MSTRLEEGVAIIQAALKSFPPSPGVYRMLGEKDAVLYIGKAVNLPKRVKSYTQPEKLPNRLKRMVSETRRMDIITTQTEVEALLLESNLIKTQEPRYNILLTDDKSYPYICITRHAFPQIKIYRGERKDKNYYFGPFLGGGAVHETITELQKAFLIRNCTDSFFATRRRPCLQYHIKRCSAPCVGYVTEEGYGENVREALDFLEGKSGDLQKDLSARMMKASENLEYEKAAALRNRIQALARIQSHQEINLLSLGDADVLALAEAGGKVCVQVFFFRGGHLLGNHSLFPRQTEGESCSAILSAFIAQFYENKEIPDTLYVSHAVEDGEILAAALRQRRGKSVKIIQPRRGQAKVALDNALKNAGAALDRELARRKSQDELLNVIRDIFELDAEPQRIEIYDNSHTSGTGALGVMVVWREGELDKKNYRKFNMKSQTMAGDDYAMMREMLSRRLKYLAADGQDRKFTEPPSLILIDGGPGQLSAARDVLGEYGLTSIPVAAVAKGPERNAGRETLYRPDQPPLQLPHNHPVLYFIQRLRDEAHRFAIGSHRSRRQKQMVKSALDEIPGVGPKRKKALLLHFGSVKSIQRAAVEDLMLVDGINRATAELIYNHFHG